MNGPGTSGAGGKLPRRGTKRRLFFLQKFPTAESPYNGNGVFTSLMKKTLKASWKKSAEPAWCANDTPPSALFPLPTNERRACRESNENAEVFC